jgi:hypothetical protein
MDIAKCLSCGRPIIWAKMLKSGKSNPVDAEPVANGNMQLTEGVAGDVFGEVLDKESLAIKHDEGELLYLSHFATCPNAAKHKRK